MTAEAGTRIGRYEIRSPLGKGGMGEVYLAHDTQLDRSVALKILPQEFAADPRQMGRFIQEAKAASALNHPNIITIHEIGQENSVQFIATEFIDGVTIRQLIGDSGMMLQETFDVAIQVASALAAAHAVGIVHRDIKPENIMVRRDGYIKVLDFGLAKLIGRATGQQNSDPHAPTTPAIHTDPGMVIGTVIYMSPEQARGLAVDTRTDIWSFGAVLYEMITGRIPFGGATASDVIASILEREPSSLARYVPGIPAEMERIVNKTLAKDVEERYQTVKDLLIDLRRLKRQFEAEADLERTVAAGANGNRTLPAHMEHAKSDTTRLADGDTDKIRATRTTSSAEYLVGEVKRHKKGATILLVAVILMAAGVVYLRVSKKTAIDSIAVLPLTNASGDAGMEDLGDRISESVRNDLSQLTHLRVAPRSSAFRYKGQVIDAQKVGHDLNVRAVLQGRISRGGDTLIVNAELIDVLNDSQLWGEQFTSSQPDLIGGALMLTLQEDFSNKILGKVKRMLSAGGQN